MVKTAKFIQAILYWPIYSVFKFFTHFKVEGLENLKGLENKAIIFASNHNYGGLGLSIDPLFCGHAMPRQGFWYPKSFFPIRFLAFREFFSTKNRYPFPLSHIVTYYVKANGSVPVEPKKGDLAEALKDAIIAVNNGDRLWIFPEGFMSMDGKIHEGKRGVAYLNKQTGAPIVPVGLIGTYKILSWSTLLLRNRVKVVFGAPIYSFGDKTIEQSVDVVMEKIKELVVIR